MGPHPLADQFANSEERRGGLVVLRPDRALALIDLAEEEGVTVLGVDGFRILDGGIQPQQEIDVDTDREVDSWEAARQVVREWEHRKDQGFEITLD